MRAFANELINEAANRILVPEGSTWSAGINGSAAPLCHRHARIRPAFFFALARPTRKGREGTKKERNAGQPIAAQAGIIVSPVTSLEMRLVRVSSSESARRHRLGATSQSASLSRRADKPYQRWPT